MTETVSTANVSTQCTQSSGFTLIEVLVTLAIIAIGLLGVGVLQARLQQTELEAYDRAQALVLLDAMVSRINANRQTAPCYAITTLTTGVPYLGYADVNHAAAVTCAGYGNASTQQTAVNDLNDWDAMLKGTSEAIGGTAVGATLGARGCITFNDVTFTYTITVTWQGMTQTAAPTVACAINAYGAETLRRAVSVTFRPAALL